MSRLGSWVSPFFAVVVLLAGGEKISADTIPEAVAALVNAAKPERGLSEAQLKASKRVIALGPDAFTAVMKLLHQPDEGVCYLASYTLDGFPGPVDPQHLPALAEALEKKTGYWVPALIAKVGTPEAYGHLLKAFLSDASCHHTTTALEQAGRKLAPLVGSIYASQDLSDSQIHDFGGLMEKMKEEDSAVFLPVFLAVAADGTKSDQRRAAALATAARIKSAEREIGIFRHWKQQGPPALRSAAAESLLKLPGSESLEEIIGVLGRDSGEMYWVREYQMERLRFLEGFGESGREAGPAVMRLFAHKSAELAGAAIRASGFIDYRPAIPALVELLKNEADWPRAYAAAVALTRLKAPEALPFLQAVSSEYWFPFVKAKAALAVRILEGGAGALPVNGQREFFDKVDRPAAIIGEAQLKRLDQEWALESEREFRETGRVYKMSAELRSRFSADDFPPVNFVMMGYETQGGLLLGWDKGEFGGGLEFFPAGGKSIRVMGYHALRLHRAGDEFLAAVDCWYEGLVEGAVRRVSLSDGKWTHALWRILPGRPKRSWLKHDGPLVVICGEGMIQVHPDGRMEWVNPP